MLRRQMGASMASSDRDKGKYPGGKQSGGKQPGGKRPEVERPRSKPQPEDPIGPPRPRWGDPRPRVPIAIALDYKKGGKLDPKAGPRVAATGKGAVADQILQIAFERGIPVRE